MVGHEGTRPFKMIQTNRWSAVEQEHDVDRFKYCENLVERDIADDIFLMTEDAEGVPSSEMVRNLSLNIRKNPRKTSQGGRIFYCQKI